MGRTWYDGITRDCARDILSLAVIRVTRCDSLIDNTRRVVRQITNLFCFFREVRRYGPDCVVVSPTEVRDRFAAEIAALHPKSFAKAVNLP